MARLSASSGAADCYGVLADERDLAPGLAVYLNRNEKQSIEFTVAPARRAARPSS